ncbi:MAG: prepilin-type N-terminal cleavage/methylation domain-containing protein [Candidatus Omnitrophica bacterium]|nr:prepilin-type N-terminal cleavage/methylation domain-containing protein [Candidatus Omnitrophota bacterium]MBI2173984.1 prepilin-type N-terminal cleavage/methylation domain-containing protein [Candidatus Omnitrophota bacterium]
MKTHGFTLIEMLIVSILFISFSLLATLWFTNVSALWWTATTQSSVRTDLNLSMDRVAAELRSATRSAVGSPPNLAIPAPPGNATMTFYLPIDLDANGTIVDVAGNTEWDTLNPVQYQYNQATGQLLRLVGLQQTVLAQDLIAVTFADAVVDPSLRANEVRLSMTMERRTPQRRDVMSSASRIVRLRN